MPAYVELDGEARLSALELARDVAGGSEEAGLAAGTDQAIGNTLNSIMDTDILNPDVPTGLGRRRRRLSATTEAASATFPDPHADARASGSSGCRK